jgi:hypothetical protein
MPNATQEGVIHKVDTAKYLSITCDVGSTYFTGKELNILYIRVCIKGTTDDTFLSIRSQNSISSANISKMIK